MKMSGMPEVPCCSANLASSAGLCSAGNGVSERLRCCMFGYDSELLGLGPSDLVPAWGPPVVSSGSRDSALGDKRPEPKLVLLLAMDKQCEEAREAVRWPTEETEEMEP